MRCKRASSVNLLLSGGCLISTRFLSFEDHNSAKVRDRELVFLEISPLKRGLHYASKSGSCKRHGNVLPRKNCPQRNDCGGEHTAPPTDVISSQPVARPTLYIQTLNTLVVPVGAAACVLCLEGVRKVLALPTCILCP